MGRFMKAWRGEPVIFALGLGLSVIHFVHATAEDASFRTVVFGILLATLVSIGVLLGSIWLWKSTFDAAATRRVAAWCLVGGVVLTLGSVLTILYQQAHGVTMDDREFVVLSSTSFGTLIGFVVGVYDAQRHRQKQVIQTRERALDELHSTTRDLVQKADREAIATRAVETAQDILNLPINACWLYDDGENILTPVAATDEGTELVGELPIYTEGDSLSWEAFETGEVKFVRDVRGAPNRYSMNTPIRSEIILPLGEYGVMNIGSTETDAFDEIDVSLVRILAANTQTALERADREQKLAATRDQAKHLNRQLTVLNRVFRHDLRNAANVIRGHAGLLVESAGSETSRDSAVTIRKQATELVEMGEQIRSIERILQNDSEEREVVDIAEIITTHLDRVERNYPAVQTDGPTRDTCCVLAHPLIESAIRNVIDNAVEHNDTQTPRVDVEISEAVNGRVGIRIADNGPGIPDGEVTVLERGYETPLEHTSGLGLWLVSWIVRESDGDVFFNENSPRGSVVGLRFEKADFDELSEDATMKH